MNDKQQLAAMGEHLAEQQQPMCMAKRIEELEAQVRVMAGLLRETLTYVDGPKWQSLIDDRKAHLFLGRIDAAISGSLPAPVSPEGWQLVPVEPTKEMSIAGCQVPLNKAARHNTVYRAMLSASPKPGSKP